MASSDFMYEDKLRCCPVDETVAENILQWIGIGIDDAKKYIGVSTCRAVLAHMAKNFQRDLYPPEYRTPGFDRE